MFVTVLYYGKRWNVREAVLSKVMVGQVCTISQILTHSHGHVPLEILSVVLY